ncbi:hypothetical protein E2C01_016691 [Portunus trituberculatus]|uniref:Uncharacterized protein n=1 Tax=Portunus trituberculatus TaxID=210409 RepID=A0A5B7DPS5_PORTR|nr:hypothetical protein [Portunus trituberculatus]
MTWLGVGRAKVRESHAELTILPQPWPPPLLSSRLLLGGMYGEWRRVGPPIAGLRVERLNEGCVL